MESIDFREFLSVKRINVPHRFIDRSIFVAGFFGVLSVPPAVAAAATIQLSADEDMAFMFLNLSSLLVILAYIGIFCALSSMTKVVCRSAPVIYRMAQASCWQEFKDRFMCWRQDNRVHACKDEKIRADRTKVFNTLYRRLVDRWGNTI